MQPGVVRLLDGGHVQPDRCSCGAQVVVMAAAVHDPHLVDGLFADPGALRAEVLVAHRTLTRLWGPGLQLPWPRRLGTPPWAVARALTRMSGVPHRVHATLPWRRARLFQRVLATTRGGRPVALYVGSGRLPRHVVLAVPGPGTGNEVLVHDPATGRLRPMGVARWCASTLDTVGWPVPWFVVLPAAGPYERRRVRRTRPRARRSQA